MKTTNQKKKAVVYARYSSDLQQDRSIEDQLHLCRTFAEKQGYQVSDVFSDRARSGSSIFGREGLLAMMEAAKTRAFDVVIVEELDRLSRDQEDLAAIFKRLQFIGVDIVAVHAGRADAVQVGIRGLIGSLFLTDLANKTRRGQSGRIKDGLSAGGKAYGYNPVLGKPGELTIDEEKADVVRRIFREFATGNSPRTIARGLNDDGIQPPRGAVWNASTINGSMDRQNGILRNAIYGGKLVWNRVRMVRDPDTGKRVSRVNPESEWQISLVPALRIIDEETMAAVQARMAGRKANGPQYQPRNKRLLSGLMICGSCGSGMTIDGATKGYPRIRCSRARESGSCDHFRRYQLMTVEGGVIDGLRKQLADPAALTLFIETYFEERRRLAIENANNRNRIERDLSKRRTELERLLDAYMKGLFSVDQLAERRPPIDADIARLEAALEEAPALTSVAIHPAAVERYMRLIDAFATELPAMQATPSSKIMEMFRELVDAVIIYPSPPHGAIEIEIKGKLNALLGDTGQLPPKSGKLAIELVAGGRSNQNSQKSVMTIALISIRSRKGGYTSELNSAHKKRPAPRRSERAG